MPFLMPAGGRGESGVRSPRRGRPEAQQGVAVQAPTQSASGRVLIHGGGSTPTDACLLVLKVK